MKRSQQILTLLLCFFVTAALLIACSKSSGYSTGNNGGSNDANSVSIAGFAFSSNKLTVAKGTEVTWTNNDATAHTVTADDGSFDSGNIPAGGTYQHTFNTAGTIKYHCAIHPMMTGSVVVQ